MSDRRASIDEAHALALLTPYDAGPRRISTLFRQHPVPPLNATLLNFDAFFEFACRTYEDRPFDVRADRSDLPHDLALDGGALFLARSPPEVVAVVALHIVQRIRPGAVDAPIPPQQSCATGTRGTVPPRHPAVEEKPNISLKPLDITLSTAA